MESSSALRISLRMQMTFILKGPDSNPDGALYKVYSNTFPGDSGNSGVEKKNRKYENNQDLTDFIRGINNGNTAQQWEFIYDNVNLPMCINMAAANRGNKEHRHAQKKLVHL